MSKDREFYWRRLHSLLGIIPVGLFLTQHLVVNHFATRGEEAFNNATSFMESLTICYFLRDFHHFLTINVPCFLWYLYCIYSKKQPEKLWYIYVTGCSFYNALLEFFLLSSLHGMYFETRFQAAIGAKEVNFDMMAEILSNPWMLGFYIVGVIAATFHFANGIWSFLVSWGITQSPQSQQIATYVTLVILLSVICSWCSAIALLAYAY